MVRVSKYLIGFDQLKNHYRLTPDCYSIDGNAGESRAG